MSTEDVIESEQSPDTASPGQLLAQARESAALSQKDVADRLHITVHYVRSIEQDAYEKLPGAIFAKGYIKRYAEILEVDVAQTLQAFEDFQQDQQAQRAEVTRIHARKNRARNRNFAIASVLAFVALFVGLWGWNVMTAAPDTAVDNRPRNDVIGDRIASALEQEDLQSAQATNEGKTDSVPEPALVSDQPLPAASDEMQAARSAAAETAKTVDGSESAVPAASDVTVIAISNDGNDILRVSFDDDSFIQVSDEFANRLYRGTLGKGEVLEIKDQAPFDVLVSDAPLTHMTLNGAEIDLMESVRIDNSARLTVGL